MWKTRKNVRKISLSQERWGGSYAHMPSPEILWVERLKKTIDKRNI